MSKELLFSLLLLFACTIKAQEYRIESKPSKNWMSSTPERVAQSLQTEELATLSEVPLRWDQSPKRVIRRFSVDSPFGTLIGNDSNIGSMEAGNTTFKEKNYRLLVCFTGVGLRIDL
ncbi:MAG: hypothetical protein AAGA66_18585 [Bacteroidota bacterium]